MEKIAVKCENATEPNICIKWARESINKSIYIIDTPAYVIISSNQDVIGGNDFISSNWVYENGYKVISFQEFEQKYLDNNTELTSLPEKWCIKSNPEIVNILGNYWNEQLSVICYTEDWALNQFADQYWYSHNLVSNEPFGPYGGSNHTSKNKKEGFVEITFDQFKKWVLKEIPKESKSLVGRYLKALVDAPQRINGAKSGEYFLIEKDNLCEEFTIKRLLDNSTGWTANKFLLDKTWELMPEGFTPPIGEEVPDFSPHLLYNP